MTTYPLRNGGSQKERERTLDGWGKPPHFDRLRWRKGGRGQSRRNAEDASEARGPGGGWHGGGGGTLGVSSQEAGVPLMVSASAALRIISP